MGSRAAARHNALGLGSAPRSLPRCPTCPPPPSRGLPTPGRRPLWLPLPLPYLSFPPPFCPLPGPQAPRPPSRPPHFLALLLVPSPLGSLSAPPPRSLPSPLLPPPDLTVLPSLQRSPSLFNPSLPPSLFSLLLTLSLLPPYFSSTLPLSLFPTALSLFPGSVSLHSPALDSMLLSTYP